MHTSSSTLHVAQTLRFAGFGLVIGLFEGILLSGSALSALGVLRAPNDDLAISLLVVFSIVCLFISLAHALLPRHMAQIDRILPFVSSIVCVIGLFAPVALSNILGFSGLTVGGIMLGAGLAPLWLAWIEALRESPAKLMGTRTCIACLCASGVCLIVVTVPSYAASIFALACAPTSALLLFRPQRKTSGDQESASLPRSNQALEASPGSTSYRACINDLLAPFFCMIAVSFIFGTMGQVALGAPAGSTVAIRATSIAMAISACVLVLLASSSRLLAAPVDSFRLVFPILLGLLFLLPFLEGPLQPYVNACVVASYWLMLFVFILFTTTITQREGVPCAPIAGIAIGVTCLFSLAGVWFGTFVGSGGYGFVQLTIIAFVSGYALVAALLFLSRQERLDQKRATAGTPPVAANGNKPHKTAFYRTVLPDDANGDGKTSSGIPEAASEYDIAKSTSTGESRCIALARQYGLTSREAEVLSLLAQGRSGTYISEHLCVSKNTVKGHVKSIYTKLGIHSKQELIDLCA